MVNVLTINTVNVMDVMKVIIVRYVFKNVITAIALVLLCRLVKRLASLGLVLSIRSYDDLVPVCCQNHNPKQCNVVWFDMKMTLHTTTTTPPTPPKLSFQP